MFKEKKGLIDIDFYGHRYTLSSYLLSCMGVKVHALSLMCIRPNRGRL